MSFSTRWKVRFADVDPAGIVFYPRYFEMLNAAVEDWFEALGADFSSMHFKRRIGVPTVRLDCEFLSPSELGEELTVTVAPFETGRTSCTVHYRVEGGGRLRLRASGVLVCMDLAARRAIPWPDDIRSRLAPAAA